MRPSANTTVSESRATTGVDSHNAAADLTFFADFTTTIVIGGSPASQSPVGSDGPAGASSRAFERGASRTFTAQPLCWPAGVDFARSSPSRHELTRAATQRAQPTHRSAARLMRLWIGERNAQLEGSIAVQHGRGRSTRVGRTRLLFQMVATLILALAALGMLLALSASLVGQHFQYEAQLAIRHVFTQGGSTKEGVEYAVTCHPSDAEGGGPSACDPLAIKGADLFRNGRCRERVGARLLGNHWGCVAKFKDGSTLALEVSVGLRNQRLDLFLPVREPGA